MTVPEDSLREIISQAKAGDRKAFDLLYHEYFTPIYRFVFMRVKNSHDAEDITQDTFLKAYEALDRYQHDRGTMLPYLFTIARNLVINHGKKKRPESYLPEEIDRHADEGTTADGAILRETQERIRVLMEVLSDTEQQVVELRFFAEKSYTEIAKALGKSEEAIRQHIARGLRKMRVNLQKEDYE